MNHNYQFLTWEDVKSLDKDKAVILIPLGSIEQHGPQNPIGTDYLISTYIAEKASEKNPKAYSLPPIPIGVSSHHRNFPGTLWFSPDVFRSIVREIFLSLKHHGFRKIIVVNGHGGNTSSIMEVIGDFNDRFDFIALLFEWWKDEQILKKVIGHSQVIHADEVETSVIWAIYEEYVKEEKFEKLTSSPMWGRYIGDLFLSSRTDQFTKSGIAGALNEISRENGLKILEACIDKLDEHIKLLSNYKG
ncbi:MAG: creatininase family protein [Candidatus Heimdallarchaeum endolithica]|uniref:Creatininase family protein n=1 Tax=Candidatus Heimdallarchaeum endolithica TaxID=2876572 RepID=A0A9Y1BT71_9ARCH|nr:MAG: creatininase family protein [Candidatus Heimdallarchaeum endolithica]